MGASGAPCHRAVSGRKDGCTIGVPADVGDAAQVGLRTRQFTSIARTRNHTHRGMVPSPDPTPGNFHHYCDRLAVPCAAFSIKAATATGCEA